MSKLPAMLLLACVANGSLAEMPGYAMSEAQLATVRAELRAAEEAEHRARAEFAALRARGALTREERDAYQTYLGYLQQRVVAQRAALAGLSPGISDVVVDGSIAESAADTHQEHVQRLDGQLNDALSEFDEMLLREMQELAERRAAGDDAEAGGAPGATGSGQASGQAAGAAGEDSTGRASSWEEAGRDGSVSGEPQTDAGATRTPQDETASAEPGHGPRAAPTGLPDGSDDDVVARQLREAAEKETDPELKKRLWEEYRKYKTGA